MGWLLAGVLLLAALAWWWTRGGKREPDAFEATATHVEREPIVSRTAYLENRYRVRVTYRRDDGDDGSFTFEESEPELRYTTLGLVAPGDRLIKGARDVRPRRLPELGPSSWLERELDWEDTANPDAPYATEHEGVALTLEVNPRSRRWALYLFVDGTLEGGVPTWPDTWSRPAP